jgi:hypothetical protein
MSTDLLVPMTMFFTMTALYLGGMSVDIAGGSGGRQVLSLIVMFVLFMGVWFGLHLALGGATGGMIMRVVVPTVITVPLIPIFARVAFMILGMRVEKGHAAH